MEGIYGGAGSRDSTVQVQYSTIISIYHSIFPPSCSLMHLTYPAISCIYYVITSRQVQVHSLLPILLDLIAESMVFLLDGSS